jgi:hypothetical protein
MAKLRLHAIEKPCSYSDRRSIFKNTGKTGSGRLISWTEDVFCFSRLLSCLERWRVDQKRANRHAEKPLGGNCRIIRNILLSAEMARYDIGGMFYG